MIGGFVVKIKDTETDTPRFKATFLIRGKWEKENNTLVLTSTMMKHTSTQLLIALATCIGFHT